MKKRIRVWFYIILAGVFYLWNKYAGIKDKKIFKEIYKNNDTNV